MFIDGATFIDERRFEFEGYVTAIFCTYETYFSVRSKIALQPKMKRIGKYLSG